MDSFLKCVFVRAGKHTSVHDMHPHSNFHVVWNTRQVLQTFVNYEDINIENAVRGLLSRLHPRITHYNRIIIEYNG